MGVRAVATITASGMPRRLGRGGARSRLRLGWRHADLGFLYGRPLGPAPAADGGQLAHEGDGAGVVVAGAALDGAVLEHLDEDLAAEVGADDRERPVVEGADAAGGDVGVLGGEVGAGLAPFPGPRVALLERHFVVRAVLHPD